MGGMKVFAIAGKAGAGKDALLKKFMSAHGCYKFHKIVSCTTRPKREHEVDGVDYNYLTTKEFDDAIENGEMIEWTSFRGWKYGTRIKDLDNSDGVINLGTFNPGGVKQLRNYAKNIIDVQVFLVAASDKNRLIRQLQREENPDVEEIMRRFKTDKEDFYNFEYDVILKNDTPQEFDACVETINHQGHWADAYN